MPAFAIRALGVVSPMMRGVAEMSYEFEEPFVLDTTKCASAYSTPTTLLATAASSTIAWYRTRRSTT